MKITGNTLLWTTNSLSCSWGIQFKVLIEINRQQRTLFNKGSESSIKLDPHLTLLAKVNSKWIKDLSINIEVIKVLEENMGEFLYMLRVGRPF